MQGVQQYANKRGWSVNIVEDCRRVANVSRLLDIWQPDGCIADCAGVSKAFAIQAGREVRVMVAPHVPDEAAVAKLAFDIARKIEEELKYPGQIKVTAIKEIRASDLAK